MGQEHVDVMSVLTAGLERMAVEAGFKVFGSKIVAADGGSSGLTTESVKRLVEIVLHEFANEIETKMSSMAKLTVSTVGLERCNLRRHNVNLIEKLAREHGTGGWQTLNDMARFGKAVAEAEREACAKVEDGFACGACGMDGKAATAIRARSNV